uniref:RCC1-like domain-containing protein n=1 Tax=Trichuris muris TaxID=70415 RepID=A0A5S6QEM4_TRIMR
MSTICQAQHCGGEKTEDDSQLSIILILGGTRIGKSNPNCFWIADDSIVSVACGDGHAAVVTKKGRLLTFGSNGDGQSGIGEADKNSARPKVLKSLKAKHVVQVACGSQHTIVISKPAQAFAFGRNAEHQLGIEDSVKQAVPMEIRSLRSMLIRLVSAGAEHSAALTGDGQLLVWGSNSFGQLGIVGVREAKVPERLPFPDGIKYVDCGYWHTAIISKANTLHTFGEGRKGQLGTGKLENCCSPCLVPGLNDCTQVSCGARHTLALTGNGKVYSFGEGTNGQLGLGLKVTSTLLPALITSLTNVHSISCGSTHSGCITGCGDMFLWGNNQCGKIDSRTDPRSNYYVPKLVERYVKYGITQLALGGYHSIVIGNKCSQKEEAIYLRRMASETEKTAKAQLVNASAVIDGSITSVKTTGQLSPDVSLADPEQWISSAYDYINSTVRDGSQRNETAIARSLNRRQFSEHQLTQAAYPSNQQSQEVMVWKRSSLPYYCENLATLGQHRTRKHVEPSLHQNNDASSHEIEKGKESYGQGNGERRSPRMARAQTQMDNAGKERRLLTIKKETGLNKILHSSPHDGALQVRLAARKDRTLDVDQNPEGKKDKEKVERDVNAGMENSAVEETMKTPQKSILKKPSRQNGCSNSAISKASSGEAGNQDDSSELSVKKSVVRFLRRNTYPDQVATIQHETERSQRSRMCTIL